MQRLARAHLNCIEGLAVFGGLLAIAIMTQRTSVTDPLALWLLGVVQSLIHLRFAQRNRRHAALYGLRRG
jgi:hypothetical protein